MTVDSCLLLQKIYCSIIELVVIHESKRKFRPGTTDYILINEFSQYIYICTFI